MNRRRKRIHSGESPCEGSVQAEYEGPKRRAGVQHQREPEHSGRARLGTRAGTGATLSLTRKSVHQISEK